VIALRGRVAPALWVLLASLASTADAADSGSSTATVLCDYRTRGFNRTPAVNATGTSSWRCDGASRMLSANGRSAARARRQKACRWRVVRRAHRLGESGGELVAIVSPQSLPIVNSSTRVVVSALHPRARNPMIHLPARRAPSGPLLLTMLASLALTACGGDDSATVPDAPTIGAATAGVECSYRYDAFNSSASVNLQSTSSWTCSDTSRVLAANGVPDHAVGTFPNAGNPNTITAQTVSVTYTLTPTYNGTATTLGGPRGNTGYILNGVKIDAGTAGSCPASATATTSCSLIDNSGAWSIEALGQDVFDFGTDDNNAHVQPTGEYHYHGMPEGFITLRGGGPTKMTLIGWAADGFPIYARYGYSTATDATSALKAVTGSYQLKTTTDATRPSTTLVPLGGFAQDWEYVAGSGDLDECNGRVGVTPEFPNGIYHYYATDTYPYLQRCIKGNQ
jgi:YHYH protein